MEDIISSGKENILTTDKEFEKQLRPLCFNDFKGQKQIIDNLVVRVWAKQRWLQ
jgi:Holliday junction resolvasome RuvABC ATP-dependent DNA helicase subunit